jgi:rhamnosyltransferase
VNVFAVVVAYHPDPGQLSKLCRTLGSSGTQVIVVDNTEAGTASAPAPPDGCERVVLGENTGIAHAQNVGIERATSRGADVVVFFDQDSEPEVCFIGKLLAGLERDKPGVVAPVCVDRKTGAEVPSYLLGRLGLRRKVYSKGRTGSAAVDLVIASGTAATTSTFSLAGRMDEDLFIDFVDFEWCLRCRRKHIPIRVVADAIMSHSIGQRAVDLKIIRGPVHGVSRSYYKIRNCFLLFRKPAVPFLFAINATFSAILRHLLLLPYVNDRRAYLRVFFTAIRHGITGVVGKNPSPAGPGVSAP